MAGEAALGGAGSGSGGTGAGGAGNAPPAAGLPPTDAAAPLMVGVSGLRGIVGRSLTADVVVRYTSAFALWLYEAGSSESWHRLVAVGHDGRYGGEAIASIVAGTLRMAGVDVLWVDRCTTPTLAVAIDANGAHGGVMVTASHNPQQWNGLKLMSRAVGRAVGRAGGETGVEEDWGAVAACAPPAGVAAEIIERFEQSRAAAALGPNTGAIVSGEELTLTHPEMVYSAVVEAFGDGDHGSHGDHADRAESPAYRAVVDAVNASGWGVARELLRLLEVHAVPLYADDSGVFPHEPEPTAANLSAPGGLCDAVPGLKADIGFAQDPDADRLAIVDERGRYIGEEYTLALAAEGVLSAGAAGVGGDGGAVAGRAVIVTNLSTSRLVEDIAARWGAEVVRTPVGEANVVERMKALEQQGRRVVLGGEGNGGVIWPGVTYVRDSVSAMALVLSLMGRTGLTVSGLVERIDGYAGGAVAGGAGGGVSGRAGERYVMVKRKAPLSKKSDAVPALERLAERYAGERVDRQDGVRVDFVGGEPGGGAGGEPGGEPGGGAGSWAHVRASNTEPILRVIVEAAGEEAAEALADEIERVVAGS